MRASYLVAAAILMLPGVSLLGRKGGSSAPAESRDPRFVAGNKLLRPEGYREWIYLSSGLGMSYSKSSGAPQFTNVFVKPEAYRQFLKSGRWPEGTMFVLEERDSSTRGSINKAGRFQTKLRGLVAEVKDGSRFPEKWAFFSFTDPHGKLKDAATAFPKSACWSCHHAHGAVDNTFVQFYPTLKEIAESKRTYRNEPPETEAR